MTGGRGNGGRERRQREGEVKARGRENSRKERRDWGGKEGWTER